MRLCALLLVFVASCTAQGMRITGQTLSRRTTEAMFGSLPKSITSARVDVCSQIKDSQTIPLGYLYQNLKSQNGWTVLPHDVAFVVIASSQGSSKKVMAWRWGVFTVQVAAVAAGWADIGTTAKNTLNSAAIAGSGVLSAFSLAAPTHAYLTLDHESLPDPLVLPALACASGIVLVEQNISTIAVDFSLPSR